MSVPAGLDAAALKLKTAKLRAQANVAAKTNTPTNQANVAQRLSSTNNAMKAKAAANSQPNLRVTPQKMQKAAAARIAGTAVRGRKVRKAAAKNINRKINYGQEF